MTQAVSKMLSGSDDIIRQVRLVLVLVLVLVLMIVLVLMLVLMLALVLVLVLMLILMLVLVLMQGSLFFIIIIQIVKNTLHLNNKIQGNE